MSKNVDKRITSRECHVAEVNTTKLNKSFARNLMSIFPRNLLS